MSVAVTHTQLDQQNQEKPMKYPVVQPVKHFGVMLMTPKDNIACLLLLACYFFMLQPSGCVPLCCSTLSASFPSSHLGFGGGEVFLCNGFNCVGEAVLKALQLIGCKWVHLLWFLEWVCSSHALTVFTFPTVSFHPFLHMGITVKLEHNMWTIQCDQVRPNKYSDI